MNIIFLSSLNPHDINNWSDTTWHILKALEKNNNVTVIGTDILSQTAYFTSKNFSIKDVYEDCLAIPVICTHPKRRTTTISCMLRPCTK